MKLNCLKLNSLRTGDKFIYYNEKKNYNPEKIEEETVRSVKNIQFSLLRVN